MVDLNSQKVKSMTGLYLPVNQSGPTFMIGELVDVTSWFYFRLLFPVFSLSLSQESKKIDGRKRQQSLFWQMYRGKMTCESTKDTLMDWLQALENVSVPMWGENRRPKGPFQLWWPVLSAQQGKIINCPRLARRPHFVNRGNKDILPYNIFNKEMTIFPDGQVL